MTDTTIDSVAFEAAAPKAQTGKGKLRKRC
jgi:hypothetical protein